MGISGTILEKYVGEIVEIAETREVVYIGKNFQMNIAALCIQENPKVPEPKQKLMRHRG